MISDNIVEPLLMWYDRNKRILPWRESRDPYRIWVSEIMLQQTRVEAVKPYFDRFVSQLPDVKSLAEAEQTHLLKLWEGLGYYNRVKNMQKAARMIMDLYEGCMPDEYELLLKLPGIGTYTAGAVASIAFNRQTVAVDGNVLRIITRLTADDGDVLSEKFKQDIRRQLLQVIPKERPGDFNQAMMELGATVCLPNGAPRCTFCPWHDICMARLQGRVGEIPFKKKRSSRCIEKKTVLLIQDGDKTLIHQRPEKGLLAGMYEFPMAEGWLSKKQVMESVIGMGYRPLYAGKVEDSVHIFSHKEWHMQGWLIKVEESGFSSECFGELPLQADYYMEDAKTIQSDYPIPSAFRAYTKYVNVTLGNEVFLM